MPQVDPSELVTLPLKVFEFSRGVPLHDVWSVELANGGDCTIQGLQELLTPENLRSLPFLVRMLFSIRSRAGRVLHLDRPPGDGSNSSSIDTVRAALAEASLVPTGTPAGPFRTLYVSAKEAAFEARNATVHAVLVVALTPSDTGHRLYWGTYVEPVGRITALYMGLIDPFRRWIVYPGLESWLAQTWREARGGAAPPP